MHGLIVGGEDPKRQAYAQELRAKVKQLGLDDEITFTGNRSDIWDVYAVSDLVLSLSTKPESFGRAVLEALSLGVPVAGYDHGGVGEILATLYPQGRVPLGDQAALFSISNQLLDEVGAIKENTLFLRSDMLERNVALYENVCM
ncbi:MAG: glycosyltransferase [Amphritea sp.]